MIPGIEGFALGIVIYMLLTLWGKLSPISLRRELAALIDGLIIATIAQPIVFAAIYLRGPGGFLGADYLKQLHVTPTDPVAYVSLLPMMGCLAFLDSWFVWVIPLLLIASALSKDALFLEPALISLAIVLLINAVYHIFSECSKYKGTIGKFAAGIEVVSDDDKRLTPVQATFRYLLKAAPLILFIAPLPVQDSIPDAWSQPILLTMLGISGIVPAYCLFTGGEKSLYDFPARTKVVQQSGEPKRLFKTSLICFLVIANYLLGMSLAYQLLKK